MSYSRNCKSTNLKFANVTDRYVRKDNLVSTKNGSKEGVCQPPFAPKSRFSNDRFSNVDVLRKINRHVKTTSPNSFGYVNSMNDFANSSNCGNCRYLGANDVRQRHRAYNWFGYYDNYYNYPMHAKTKKSKSKETTIKKEKIIKTTATNKRGPIFKWVPKSVCA